MTVISTLLEINDIMLVGYFKELTTIRDEIMFIIKVVSLYWADIND